MSAKHRTHAQRAENRRPEKETAVARQRFQCFDASDCGRSMKTHYCYECHSFTSNWALAFKPAAYDLPHCNKGEIRC